MFPVFIANLLFFLFYYKCVYKNVEKIMVSVSQVQSNPGTVQFNGTTQLQKSEFKKSSTMQALSQVNNKKQVKPYKTHAGLILGSVLSGFYSLALLPTVFADKFIKDKTVLKKIPKISKSTNAIALGAYIGCGVLTDVLINKRQAKFATEMNTMGKQQTINKDENVELTSKGNAYCPTSIGKKAGVLLGGLAIPVLNAIEYKVNAKNTNIKRTKMGIVVSGLTSALAGLTLGAITDHFANKGAGKYSDKNPINV